MRYSVTGKGDYNVICKVCGWKLKASQARKRWDGLEPVCPVSCWESRHVAEFYKPRNDFHKLPYTSPDIHAHGGFFSDLYVPDDDDVLATTGVAPSTVKTLANRFTPNVSGYVVGIRVFHNALESDTITEGGEEPDTIYYDRGQATTPIWVGFWQVPIGETPVLVWSTTTLMTPGRWNTVPVVPNIAVYPASITDTVYQVGTSLRTTYMTHTLTAQDYATYNGTYSSTTEQDAANTLVGTTAPALIDVKIRKTVS